MPKRTKSKKRNKRASQQNSRQNENVERDENIDIAVEQQPEDTPPPQINENVERISEQFNYTLEELVPMVNDLLIIGERRSIRNEQINVVVPVSVPVPGPAPVENVIENEDIAHMGQILFEEFRERQRIRLQRIEDAERLDEQQEHRQPPPVRNFQNTNNYEIMRYPAVDDFLARHPIFHDLLLDLAQLGGIFAYYVWEFFLKYLVMFVYSIYVFSEIIEEEGRIIFQSTQRYFRRFDRILRDADILGPVQAIRALYRIARVFFNYQILNQYRALRYSDGRELVGEDPPYRPLLVEITIFFPYVLKIIACAFAIVFYYLCAGLFHILFRPNNM